MSRFTESTDWQSDVESIGEDQLVLHGGGDFYNGDEVTPDANTTARAYELAAKYGKRITSMRGAWWGYSEWTPDPGDVSIFEWVDA